MARAEARARHDVAEAGQPALLEREGRDLARMLGRRIGLVPAQGRRHDGAAIAEDPHLVHEEAAIGGRILLHQRADAAIGLEMIDRDRARLVAGDQREPAGAVDREMDRAMRQRHGIAERRQIAVLGDRVGREIVMGPVDAGTRRDVEDRQ